MQSSWPNVVMKIILIMVCLSLLELLASVRGDISVQDYSKYPGNSAITGTSLGQTSARSAVRCSTLCSRHEEEKGERCHAARYHGETRACELMSRSGEGAEEWLVDGQWNIYVIQMGATLAVITDHGENGFLKGLLESVYGSHYYWLGANDVLQEGVFKWETGEDWGFTAWAVTPWVQPLGYAGYNCLGIWVIGYDGWVDYLCEYGAWYVCEKDA
ncbi:PLC-like protein [Mya arenaria]|uniref:PLC-like protein n=1 Tax=Mya arenaria TaxID=6604 RepID=A0ABY7G3P2_MYAAR|nr:PLC-like protein [Mya arenaria]